MRPRNSVALLLVLLLYTANALASGTSGSVSAGAGTGTVTGPATATADRVVTWGADNTTIKDSGILLSALAPKASPTLTGTVTLPAWFMLGTDNVSLNQNLRTTDSPTFAGLTLNGPLVTGTPDNTHYNNVKNTSSPIGSNLAAGNYWTLPDETMRLRNQDNSATNILASAYHYRNIAFDNSAMDNMVLFQSLPFDEVWDNVIFTIRGYTDGKPTGALTDNVTTNFYCCASTDNTLAQCTKMFNSDPVPTGAVTLSPAINNGTCTAGKEIRISFSGINLSGKKLNITERHLRR